MCVKTINETLIHEIEIQKSKFITFIDTVHSENEVKTKIDEIRKRYPGATHYCYAYIIDNIKRFQDDGEPGGTAGMPMLHVLESNDLQHILAVVVRYFGGIKLGAGGLVRAYTNSVSESIEKSTIVELKECKIISIEFIYNNVKQIDYLLQTYSIVNKSFDEKITYEIAVNKDDIDKLIQSIAGLIENYIIKDEIIYNKKNDI